MEQRFIRWLKEEIIELACANNKFDNVSLGVGDDGAILSSAPGEQVLVADAIVDQVHFDASIQDLTSIGHKAIAVNLSDIAAMGAEPESALVSIIFPNDISFESAKQLFRGIATTAKKYGVAIIGGDSCSHDGPLTVNVTLTGRLGRTDLNPDGWRLDGAMVGDVLVVSGPLGGSLLGKHLSFEPRIDLAIAVGEKVRVNAATDISDSLLIDLSQMMRTGAVGALLDSSMIPISEDAKRMAEASGKSALEHAMQDGEDFELLFSLSSQSYDLLCKNRDCVPELFAIGSVIAEHPGKIIDSQSGLEILPVGYEHG